MTLYHEAIDALLIDFPDVVSDWQDFLNWLANTNGFTEKWDRSATFLVENIQLEDRMIGDSIDRNPEDRNPECLKNFIIECAKSYINNKPNEFAILNGYKDICRHYCLKGEEVFVSKIPDDIIRYTSDAPLLAVSRLLSPNLLSKIENKEVSLKEAAEDISALWDSTLIDGILLTANQYKLVFATFNTGDESVDEDATSISLRLALPKALESKSYKKKYPLCRITYKKSNVQNMHCPTIADAEIFTYFSPSNKSNKCKYNCGWTKPIVNENQEATRAPELVHTNISMKVVEKPIEFVGYIKNYSE